MRLWSIHPKYLDARGLVAIWREGLLARAVLLGKTRGYRHHPQLARFRKQQDPVGAVNAYLHYVFEEAQGRGYSFDKKKLGPAANTVAIAVTRGQIKYEWSHLLSKLAKRSPERFDALRLIEKVDPHPLFRVVAGEIETWEVTR